MNDTRNFKNCKKERKSPVGRSWEDNIRESVRSVLCIWWQKVIALDTGKSEGKLNEIGAPN